ncbi:unnamed protein product [marine sediment metagenome]|uniref:Uncharacterized protein n=1 Tax=marine sediment metagenome TaxID=412755 RepID=X1MEA7_9ZZZZ
MKKLTLVAGILMVAAMLSFGIDSASAQTWGSYSDAEHLNPSDSFTELHTVYMYGEGFSQNVQYRIIYWDGGGNKRQSEIQKALTPVGKLRSEHTFAPPDVDGDWHCAVYPTEYDPSSYDPADTNIVADDTLYAGGYAFDVVAITVTVIAAIGVAGLCFGIYYWMRRRYRRVEVSRN